MKISNVLIKKYREIKRDLPWRNSSDPYIIWISEVILQQTRVNQGLSYFLAFTEKYPTPGALAQAPEDEILHLWQGLGYYSRARNMHKTAQLVYARYGNNFPSRYEELITLKGIGPYTAAAVSSFAANEARAVVDGNVTRVITRFAGIRESVQLSATKKKIDEIAVEWMDPKQAGLHNQAIMELGALICKPKNPLCHSCPLISACAASALSMQDQIPFKPAPKPKKTRYLHYFVQRAQNQWIRKREEEDIWKGLYEFNALESSHFLEKAHIPFQNPEILLEKTHLLSHQKLHIRIYSVDPFPLPKNNFISVANEKLQEYGFPVVLQKLVEEKF